MKSVLTIYTKEELQNLINDSYSIRDLLNKIGLSSNGSGGYTTFKKITKQYNLALTFKKKENCYKSSDKIKFKENSTVARNTIRKFIKKNNLIEYKCSICGNNGFWLEKEISLHLDHKNGNSQDNRLENLRWLCPNCHRQTDTYGSKNFKNKKTVEKKLQTEKRKIDKMKIIEKNNKERFEKIKNINLLEFGWVEKVSKIWNVSHTSVRRIFNKYFNDIPRYKRI